MNNPSMKPMYDTNLFCEIWESSESFLADYNNTGTDTTINNHAFNPSTAPSTQDTNELNYIDQQQVAKGSATSTISGTDSKTTGQTVTKSKMDAYAQLWDLVATDVTNDYISKFKKCFKQFVAPERRMIYVTEDEEM